MAQLTVREICLKHGFDAEITRKRVTQLELTRLGKRRCNVTARLSNVYNEDEVIKAWNTRGVRGAYSTLDDFIVYEDTPLEEFTRGFRKEAHQRDAQLVIRGMSCYT